MLIVNSYPSVQVKHQLWYVFQYLSSLHLKLFLPSDMDYSRLFHWSILWPLWYLDNLLQWNQHVNNISGTANSLIGFICLPDLKSRTYTTLARPKIEYCCSVQVQVQVQVFYLPNRSTWYSLQSVCSSFLEGGRTVSDHHHQKYIGQLDLVQQRSSRFITNSLNPTSVTAMVEDLV